MAITQEKAERIAQEYSKTGFLNQEQALLKCGYSPKYVRSGVSRRLYTNTHVLEAIAKIKAEIEQETVDNRQYIDNKFKSLLKTCEDKEDRVNASRCLENMAKHRGYYAADNEQQSQSKALTEAQEAEYEEFIAWKRRQMLRPVTAG